MEFVLQIGDTKYPYISQHPLQLGCHYVTSSGQWAESKSNILISYFR